MLNKTHLTAGAGFHIMQAKARTDMDTVMPISHRQTFSGNAKNIWIYPSNYFKRMCPGQCVGSADIQAPREPYGFIELVSDLTQQPQMRKVNRIRAKKSQITMPQLQHSYAQADRGPLCAELSCVEKTGTCSHHPSKTHHTVAGI